jgi:AbrB family looped-hinge helix DNA binding protein
MDVPARLTSKGQITLSKAVREALGLHQGDRVVFRVEGSYAVLARMADLLELAGRRPVRALTLQEVSKVREAVRAWQEPAVWRPGPRHSGILADVVDVLLVTGGRIGEVLALRWCDLDLETDPATVTFAGTIVYVHGRGHVRQARTKTAAGHRTVILPRSPSPPCDAPTTT